MSLHVLGIGLVTSRHFKCCQFPLFLSAEQPASDVTDLSLFQDFKLCH